MAPRARGWLPTTIAVGIALASATVYMQTARHGFVGYDDTTYVTDNPLVRTGLSLRGVAWAFRSGHAANWHPLTWLSHMTDVSLFGLDPAGHHVVNVLFHAANSAMMFLVLRGLTGALWRSCLVALLFAVHPLHVESVAWVAERKDVLSSFWGLLATGAYAGYVRAPSGRRFSATFLLLFLALLAKPMLVTLPLVFLLLDWWPLGRLATRPHGTIPGQSLFRAALPLVREKLPLLALVAASSIVTYQVQAAGGMVKDVGAYSFGVRVATALAAYATYLGKTFVPMNLAMPIPHPGGVPIGIVAGSTLLLAAITLAALASARTRPYVVVGWFWFLGMLFPVIGLVQVADQLLADRYTYLPLTGLFVALIWGIADLTGRRSGLRRIAVAAAIPVVGGLAVGAWIQASHWKDSYSLMRRALLVTKDNYLVSNNMGFALAWDGRDQEAEMHYREALRIRPHYGKAHFNLANLLARQRRDREAEVHYRAAVEARLPRAEVHNNLGVLLTRQGRETEALLHYQLALQMKPAYPDARNNFGTSLLRMGRVVEAAEQFRETVRIAPDHALAHYNLGLAALRLNLEDEAREAFAAALRAKPDYAEARLMLDGLRARSKH